MPDKYLAGMQCVALGDDASPPANFAFMSRVEDHTPVNGPGKVVRNYESADKYDTQEVVEEGWDAETTLTGDADPYEMLPLINSVAGPISSGVYAGGDIGAAVPLLSTRLYDGRTDGNVGGALNAYYDEIKTARVPDLSLYLDRPGGKLKFQALVRGMYNGTGSTLGTGITFTRANAPLFNQGRIFVTHGGTAIKLLLFRLRFLNGADPLYTTVTTDQTTDYTSPTSHDEGLIGCAFDVTFQGSEYAAAFADYVANGGQDWAFNCKFNPKSGQTNNTMTLNVYRAIALTTRPNKNRPGSPRINITGVASFKTSAMMGHAISFGVT